MKVFTLLKFMSRRYWYLIVTAIIGSFLHIGCGGNDAALKPPYGSAWKLMPADRLVYGLKYESDSYSNLSALYSTVAAAPEGHGPGVSPHVYHVTVDATVLLTPIRHNGSGTTVSYSFPNARVTAESEMGPMIDTDRVQTELARDTYCEIDQEGRIKALLFDPTTSDATANFVRNLLGHMQFALPVAADDRGHWQIDEDDPAGTYTAEYNAVPQTLSSSTTVEPTNIPAFHKTKLAYFTASPDEGRELPTAPKLVLPDGGFDIWFDFARGRIAAISGNEKQIVSIVDKIVGEEQNSFQLTLVGEEKVSQPELALAVESVSTRGNSMPAVALSYTPSERAQFEAIYRSQLGNDSMETLKTAIEGFEKGSGKWNYAQLYSKVKALIFLHPDKCADLGTMLVSLHSNGHAAQLIRGALTAIGNSDAQDALVNAERGSRNDAEAIQLIVALGMVKKPTQITQDRLEEIAWRTPETSTAKAAQLEIGAIARNLKSFSPPRAAGIVERATAKLFDVPGAELQLIGLLGNAGLEQSLPTLTVYLADASADVRGHAAFALRFIEGEKAEQMLASVLTADPDESVRIQAANAIEFRSATQTSFNTQWAVLFSDKSESVRLTVMRNLWRSRDTYADVVPLMEKLAAEDSSEDVRRTAATLLGNG